MLSSAPSLFSVVYRNGSKINDEMRIKMNLFHISHNYNWYMNMIKTNCSWKTVEQFKYNKYHLNNPLISLLVLFRLDKFVHIERANFNNWNELKGRLLQKGKYLKWPCLFAFNSATFWASLALFGSSVAIFWVWVRFKNFFWVGHPPQLVAFSVG